MSDLKQELKEKIITQLNLEDISIDDLQDDTPLFGDGLGLDSIDALELIVLLDKQYGIKLADPKEGRKVLKPFRQWPITSKQTARNNEQTTDCHYRNGYDFGHRDECAGE